MSSVNKAIIVGRLGQDPEMRDVNEETTVARLSVATSQRYKDGEETREVTDWHTVKAWNGLAGICRDYLHKGDLVYIEGRMKQVKWDDQDGNTHYQAHLKAGKIEFLDVKRDQ